MLTEQLEWILAPAASPRHLAGLYVEADRGRQARLAQCESVCRGTIVCTSSALNGCSNASQPLSWDERRAVTPV
eukprot:10266455-Karenia_brevis.AAC.1